MAHEKMTELNSAHKNLITVILSASYRQWLRTCTKFIKKNAVSQPNFYLETKWQVITSTVAVLYI
jgi:hypothetical protein